MVDALQGMQRIMSLDEIVMLLQEQAKMRALENDDAGLLNEAAKYIATDGAMKNALANVLDEVDDLSNNERIENTEAIRALHGIETNKSRNEKLEKAIADGTYDGTY